VYPEFLSVYAVKALVKTIAIIFPTYWEVSSIVCTFYKQNVLAFRQPVRSD
jgi:hypothetical protein